MVRVPVHVPPEQLVVPLRVVVPRGPVTDCREEHVPPEHDPEPEELQELPRGPVPPPLRDQPASATDAPAVMSATAKA
ncbi:MAG: hypothetical protein HC868_05210 [Sphingomonadales bacterium]|nr:hypothetical protein [Sphingomonadales bacterium]